MHPQHSYTQFRLVSGQDLKPQSRPQRFKQRLKHWPQQTILWLKTRLFHTSDIRAWCTHDSQGAVLWSAHNPITRHTIYRVSETEIRRWIEQCHQTHLKW